MLDTHHFFFALSIDICVLILQMLIPFDSSSQYSSRIIFPPNSFCWVIFFLENNGVECVPRHRRCIRNWLIEFIIRYWESLANFSPCAKFHIHPDWSEKSRKILRSAKCTKGVSQIEPHRISLHFWAKIWLMNFQQMVDLCKSGRGKISNTTPLQSCWLQSDFRQNILGKICQVLMIKFSPQSWHF